MLRGADGLPVGLPSIGASQSPQYGFLMLLITQIIRASTALPMTPMTAIPHELSSPLGRGGDGVPLFILKQVVRFSWNKSVDRASQGLWRGG